MPDNQNQRILFPWKSLRCFDFEILKSDDFQSRTIQMAYQWLFSKPFSQIMIVGNVCYPFILFKQDEWSGWSAYLWKESSYVSCRIDSISPHSLWDYSSDTFIWVIFDSNQYFLVERPRRFWSKIKRPGHCYLSASQFCLFWGSYVYFLLSRFIHLYPLATIRSFVMCWLLWWWSFPF